MNNLNPLKIYSLAIFHLIMPKTIKRKFHFKISWAENTAIGIRSLSLETLIWKGK
jgi:hypothetical protein